MSDEPVESVQARRRKGGMEHVIETVAGGMGNAVGWMAETGVLFAIFAVMWIVFAAALIFSQGSVDQAWQAIGNLPLIVRIAAWLLFLPVMVGLWIWESTLPLVMRFPLLIGVAGWNLLVLLPRAMQAKP
jgi:hypothetical protein